MSGEQTVNARWEELAQMDRAALRVAWAEAFEDAPPHFLSMIFMRKAVIWHMQCKKFGGPKPDLKRALRSAAASKSVQAQAPQLRAGTQLVREWNGQRYQVEVTDDGFRMDGAESKSLSAIALRITGSTWSGPRFFGLNSQAGPG